MRVYNPTSDLSGKTSCSVKSTFCPLVNNASIETFCNLVDKDIDNLLKSSKHGHYDKYERSLRTNLSKGDVVYKPADKGGGIVLMDKKDYVSY